MKMVSAFELQTALAVADTYTGRALRREVTRGLKRKWKAHGTPRGAAPERAEAMLASQLHNLTHAPAKK